MQLFLYAHTHWDREWYLPFEAFRCQLPQLLNKVIAGLNDGSLPNFYLDGQAAILTDTFEIAPQLAEPVKKLMADGRLAAGPWYILADQMLVSGESLIRNLRVGIKTTKQFGEPAKIGYCPDTFGHSQDLPRILSGFGINNAIVWRGVSAQPTSPVFWWQSPDNSRVLTYHLNRGYYQTFLHENQESDTIVKSLRTWLEPKPETNHSASSYCSFIDGALVPVGGDHIFPPANLSGIIDAAHKELSDDEIDIWPVLPSDFVNVLSAAITSTNAQLSTVHGELRDNSDASLFERAFLLPGVLSTRLYLKRANRIAEYRITNILEPLAAFLATSGKIDYPAAQLDHAWLLLLKNQPHDSICGCSIDDVHNEMMVRTSSFHNILNDLEHQASSVVAGQTSKQTISYLDPAFEKNRLIAFNLSAQAQAYPVKMSWYEEADVTRKKHKGIQLIKQELREELFSGPGIVPYYKNIFFNEGWVWPGTVEGISSKTIKWAKQSDSTTSPDCAATSASKIITNGLLTAQVAADGALTVKDEKGNEYGLNHSLRDVGDGGDTYNFDPLENDSPIESKFVGAKIGLKGPLVSSLILTYEIKIPEKAIVASESKDGIEQLARAPKSITHRISTEVSLRKNMPIVFFETSWENKSKDHRLEVVLNTGKPITQTKSENHFSLVEREHKPNNIQLPVAIACEAPVDRFPCQRFFIANNQLFLNTGLPEYGVDRSKVTITILRAVSILSRGRMRTRGGGAGPHLPTPEANCLGPNIASYAWAPLAQAGDNQTIEAYDLAERFEGRIYSCLSQNEFDERLFAIENKALRLVSLHQHAEELCLRLLNVTSSEQTLTLKPGFPIKEAALCNLAGERLSTLPATDSAINLSIPPHALINIHLMPLTKGSYNVTWI